MFRRLNLTRLPGEAVVGQEADHAGDLDGEVDGADELVLGPSVAGARLGDLAQLWKS